MTIEIQVFSKQEIKNWENDIEKLQEDINASEQKTIPAHQEKIVELTPLLNQYEIIYRQQLEVYQQSKQPDENEKQKLLREIQHHDRLISNEEDNVRRERNFITDLERRIDSLKSYALNHQIHDLMHHKHRGLAHQVADAIDEIERDARIREAKSSIKEHEKQIQRYNQQIAVYKGEKGNLNQKLSAVEEELNRLLQEHNNTEAVKNYRYQTGLIQQERNAIASEQQKNTIKRENIAMLQQTIKQANEFLENLILHPAEMFRQLSNDLLQKIQQYEEKNLNHNDDDIHIAALEFPHKMAVIIRAPVEEKGEGSSAQEWHVKYACLTGYLWNLYDRFKQNRFLEKIIREALQNTHIKKNEALPDELASESCTKIFDDFQKRYPHDARDFNISDVHDQYEGIYKELSDELPAKMSICGKDENQVKNFMKTAWPLSWQLRIIVSLREQNLIILCILKS